MADEDQRDKQEPEKPKKRKRGGGISLPVMIIIGLGAVLIQVALVVFLVKFVIAPSSSATPAEAEQAQQADTKKQEEEKKKKTDDIDANFTDVDDLKSYLEEKGATQEYITTKRITTNPKGLTKFVVLELGMFVIVPKENKEFKEKREEAEAKIIAITKGVINQEIGAMTIEQLQEKRLKLPDIFKDLLKPILKKENIYLREVVIQEFIIQ